jgi:hypothetical protein
MTQDTSGEAGPGMDTHPVKPSLDRMGGGDGFATNVFPALISKISSTAKKRPKRCENTSNQ